MRPEEFEYLYRLEEKFWWFVGMRRITDAVIERRLERHSPIRVLDAGCGTGFNLAHFSATGNREVFGLDFSAGAIEGVRRRGFRKVCQASITEIPFESSSFDLVVSFDVLCQGSGSFVESGFREMQRVLRPGGFLFVRVPAFEWMTSSHDTAVGSSHRFTCSEIAREANRAGLQVEWISYANSFLFPVVIVRRVLKSIGVGRGSDVRPMPAALGWLDPVFRLALQSEAALFRSGIRLPFGLSVICLAQKP
jgi:SAM-dependent methyltransferase